MSAATIFIQRTNFIDACYIVAFSLFIYGMSGLTGPRTAVRGNMIAAVGMLIAIAFGTINIVGGFVVTDRMLGMFKRKPDLPSGESAGEIEREGK